MNLKKEIVDLKLENKEIKQNVEVLLRKSKSKNLSINIIVENSSINF